MVELGPNSEIIGNFRIFEKFLDHRVELELFQFFVKFIFIIHGPVTWSLIVIASFI